MGFGFGFDEPSWFTEITVRPGYHDRLDPPGGYSQGAQIDILSTTLRYDFDQSDLVLESLQIIDIMSFVPRHRLLKPLSWKAGAEVSRRRFATAERSLVPQVSGGIGLSYGLNDNIIGSMFAESGLYVNDRFQHTVLFGIGPRIGVIGDLAKAWRMEILARSQFYMADNVQPSYEIALNQQINLFAQSALRLNVARKREFGSDFTEGKLSWYVYF